MFPIDSYRSDTPGCGSVIHFNNAGCSLHPKPVVEAVKEYIETESLVGGYELAALRADAINDFYRAGAEVLNAAPHNIAFVNSATDGFTKALSSISFQKGDRILTTINDYVSSQIQFAAIQNRFGVEIIRAANTETGEADVDSIAELIQKHKPVLVSITHVPNNTGMVQPIEAIGHICAEHNIWYFVDACQSAGQLPLDVQHIQCDFLTFSMRKFMRGPRGGGLLFVSDKALEHKLEPMLPDMRGADWIDANAYRPVPDAKRFEYTEQSYAIVIGSAIAMRYYVSVGPQAIEQRNIAICNYLREQMRQFAHITLLDKGIRQSSIISLISSRTSNMLFRDTLHTHGINCGAAMKKFALLDFMIKQVDGAVRISPHYYNTFAEIDHMTDVIKRTGI